MHFKKYFLAIIMSIILISLAGFTLLSTQTVLATYPGKNGLIAFERNLSDNDEIFTMNPDGSVLTRLTNNPSPNGDDDDPRWSADGSKIVFDSTRDGGAPQIYVMNADGSDQVQLTDEQYGDDDPAWQPIKAAVGGVVIPINRLTILAPYIALACILGAIIISVAVKRKL